jgi:hypothetical protein
VTRIKFRHNAAVSIAGVIAFLGAIPVATIRWYLVPILVVPLAVALWGAWAGTDADPAGVSVRALFGRRRWAWDQITAFVPSDRRVHAMLQDGAAVPLPAVRPSDLPKLVAASGHELAAQSPAQ